MDKVSGSDGIPAELFKILKNDAVKVLHSICQQIWKTEQWLPQGWRHWWQESWKVSFGVSPLGGHLYPYHRASRLHGCITSGQQVGGKHLPLAGNWIKALLSTALPIRERPSFPHSQSFPSGNLHWASSLIYQRADRRSKKKHNHTAPRMKITF